MFQTVQERIEKHSAVPKCPRCKGVRFILLLNTNSLKCKNCGLKWGVSEDQIWAYIDYRGLSSRYTDHYIRRGKKVYGIYPRVTRQAERQTRSVLERLGLQEIEKREEG